MMVGDFFSSLLAIPITQTHIGENVHTGIRLVSTCPTGIILPFSLCDHPPSHCTPVHSSAHCRDSGAIRHCH